MDRPDQALGHPDRRAGVDQFAAQLTGACPLAALAQHVDEAGDAGELGADVLAGPAEAERGVQRFLGAAVVGGVVEDHAEALVELGRDRRQVVLEGQGKRAADRLQPGLELAPLGLRDAQQAAGANAEVEPVRRRRVLERGLRELDRLAVAGPGALVVGHRQPLERGIGEHLVGGEGLRRKRVARQRRCRAPLSGRRPPPVGAGHGQSRGCHSPAERIAASSRSAFTASVSSPDSSAQRA